MAFGFGLGFPYYLVSSSDPDILNNNLELEDGDDLLLEDGGFILLES
jgi:hypothetical protein